jgi:hypothetical protein
VSEEGPLVVAIAVEALVVNDATRHGQHGVHAWMRSQMNYNALHNGGNGAARQVSDARFTSEEPAASAFYNGVYLKWRLPPALTRGVHEGASGKTTYPAIPNRWLVVRSGGPANARTACAWIVESDYAWPGAVKPANASEWPTVYPGLFGGTVPYAASIGRNVPLERGASWKESGHKLGLTAVGPGNPAFGQYQPQNNNVLSLIDPLGAAGAAAQTLSYSVLGWFSDTADDPLSNPEELGFALLLKKLGWSLPEHTDATLTASRSLLWGSVDGVLWQTATAPAGGPPSGAQPLSIAIGNTSAEALTTLVATQAEAQHRQVDAELFEAFQLDAVDVLDRPDGAAELAERLHASCFQRFSGGYEWALVAAPGQTAPEGDFSAALASLNKAQTELDEAGETLAELQSELYTTWWKSFTFPTASAGVAEPVVTDAELEQLLESGRKATAAAQAAVTALAQQVPQGDTPEALAAAVAAYQKTHGIPETLLLKRLPRDRYYAPKDPVVLIAGAGASGIADTPASTLVRFPTQLVEGIKLVGPGETTVSAATPGLHIPTPDLTGVSGAPWEGALVSALLVEAFFVDPANATLIGTALGRSDYEAIAARIAEPAAATGTYPAGAASQWMGNPWRPLLLMYGCNYFSLPYATSSSENWRFEGAYELAAAAPSVAVPGPGPAGTIMLAATAALNMKARLEQFLANNPNMAAEQRAAFEALMGFVTAADTNWDLLSQALDGFNDQLLLRQTGVYVHPEAVDPGLAATIGDAVGNPPALGPVPAQGHETHSLFQNWRAGQFYLSQLILVDEWGQALWPLPNETAAVDVYRPAGLTPVLTSAGATFTVGSAPAIDSLTPAVAAAGGEPVTIVLTGSGFASGATAALDGTPLQTTPAGGGGLTATVPSTLLVAGEHAVTVAAGGGTSAPVGFAVSAGPVVDRISPCVMQAGTAGSSTIELTVTGANFAAGATVGWHGLPLATRAIDSTELVAQIPAAYLAAPCSVPVAVESGGSNSNAVTFAISEEAVVQALTPASALAGSGAITVTVDGVGFDPLSTLHWAPAAGGPGTTLPTSFVSANRLTATISPTLLGAAATFTVSESTGSSIVPTLSTSVIQLPPALLQPGRLLFELVSASDDAVTVGPGNPEADPVCGWVLPNHLDESLLAYAPNGQLLGAMALDVGDLGEPHVCWTAAPGAQGLAQLAASLPHFGPFLLALSQQPSGTFAGVLNAIDETLWSTQPIGAAFDRSLAVLLGRPLAMVRASLQLDLAGKPRPDPSWQFTATPATPEVTGYAFPAELGNVAQLEDGLIGYFSGDDYSHMNVVVQSGADADGYLKPIGQEGNYVPLTAGSGQRVLLSMLLDPRAAVHATTGILPVGSLEVPDRFVAPALAAMCATFRLSGVLTEERTAIDEHGTAVSSVVMPLPGETTGSWSWLEKDGTAWTASLTTAADAAAHLGNTAPVLRQGLLQLTTPNPKGAKR